MSKKATKSKEATTKKETAIEREEAVNRDEVEPTPATSWHIELDWFPQHNRSVTALIQPYLCAKCIKKLTAKGNIPSAESLMTAIGSCCSRSAGFIDDQLPIMESAFRLFLANGNQPLTVEELSRQISERRGGDPYRTAPEILLRLLRSDRYYGIQEIIS